MALLLPLLLLASSLTSSAADTLWNNCNGSAGNFTIDSTYSSNLNLTLSSLSSSTTSIRGFATKIEGSIPNRVYGLVFCRGDISATTCLSCISTAASDIQQICPYYKDAAICYDYCQLRYSNKDFLTAPDISSNIKLWMRNSQRISAKQLRRFETKTTALMDSMIDFAVRNTGQYFTTGETALDGKDVVYGLVQCARDLPATNCRSCLQEAVDQITEKDSYLKGWRGGRVLGIWCNMRYEFYKFYNGTSLVQQSASSQPQESGPLKSFPLPSSQPPMRGLSNTRSSADSSRPYKKIQSNLLTH